MGEIADDMIGGVCCSLCNGYFTEDHGYPVACKPCFKDWKKLHKKGKAAFTKGTGLLIATENLMTKRK